MMLLQILGVRYWLRETRFLGTIGALALPEVLLQVYMRADLFLWEKLATLLNRRAMLVYGFCKEIVVHIYWFLCS